MKREMKNKIRLGKKIKYVSEALELIRILEKREKIKVVAVR